MEMAHLYTGQTGRSRFEDMLVPFITGSSRDAPFVPAAGVQFRRSEGERTQDWHPAPRRQLLVLLSGRMEITAGDGTGKRLYPGDFFLADDLSGQGHITTTRGECVRAWIAMPDWKPQAGKMDLPQPPAVQAGQKMRKGQFVRLHTGPDNKTHFQDLDGLFLSIDASRDAPFIPTTGIQFLRSEGESFGDWHHAPRRQFVVILSGELEVEVGSGAKRTFTTGDTLLAEDLTGQGHTTRSRGDRRLMFVALADGAKVPGVN
ncbi:MAG: cupin domain-containing protein [SAR202 cluster bacterium]|nr:cupin domain-containing protein [SAR202 cluster bacterium]